jgi:hypothetical protein
LAQNTEDVASYQSSLPVNAFTILIVPPNGGEQDFIKHITYDKCTTVNGTGYNWHNADPTEHFAGISIPELTVGDYRLLENGDVWLREDDGFWLIQSIPQTGPYFLTEDGGFLLLEDSHRLELI